MSRDVLQTNHRKIASCHRSSRPLLTIAPFTLSYPSPSAGLWRQHLAPRLNKERFARAGQFARIVKLDLEDHTVLLRFIDKKEALS